MMSPAKACFLIRPASGWRSQVLLAIVLLVAVSSSLNAENTERRVFRDPPARTVIQSGYSPEHIIIKFSEETHIRLRDGDFRGAKYLNPGRVKSVLARHGVQAANIRPMFSRSDQVLAEEKQRGEQLSGRTLADLGLYYVVRVLSNVNVAELCDALNALDIIESAVPAPPIAPLPIDIAPATPNFTGVQGYRSLATGGIGIDEVAAIPGTDGAGTAFADVEFDWILDHEDLELPPSAIIGTGTIDSPYAPDHGTAVLGMLVAKDNDYGVTGMVPAATAMVSPVKTVEEGGSVAWAINNAVARLSPGDVILIEVQAWVCNGTAAYGPTEWHQWNFDAMQTATALGIIVVAGAGNGYGNGAQNLGVNLDDPACDGLFDRNVRDSGAILVGAAVEITRNKTGYSTYGSRVDVQGWGNRNIVTAGFGDLFSSDPVDPRQSYTGQFSGTSSAAPIVVAAVIAIQGARAAAGEPPLSPAVMRDLLVTTGLPQGTGGHIGPLPNLPAAIAETLGLQVAKIDVNPWTDISEIKPGAVKNITVAVKTTNTIVGDVSDIDATQVDPVSLKFGSGEVPSQADPLIVDVDADADLDAVFIFEASQSGILCGDEEVALSGQTYSGDAFIGVDSIVTVECEVAGCHP
jgi:serine protease